jgi:hypothetical protein
MLPADAMSVRVIRRAPSFFGSLAAPAGIWRQFGNAKPMDLPEYSTAADAMAQFSGNPTGWDALRPPRF